MKMMMALAAVLLAGVSCSADLRIAEPSHPAAPAPVSSPTGMGSISILAEAGDCAIPSGREGIEELFLEEATVPVTVSLEDARSIARAFTSAIETSVRLGRVTDGFVDASGHFRVWTDSRGSVFERRPAWVFRFVHDPWPVRNFPPSSRPPPPPDRYTATVAVIDAESGYVMRSVECARLAH
jgi:hypothetical protein